MAIFLIFKIIFLKISHWAALYGRLSVILKMILKVRFNSYLTKLQVVLDDFQPQMPGNVYFSIFLKKSADSDVAIHIKMKPLIGYFLKNILMVSHHFVSTLTVIFWF